jgi:hypothetical protein
VARATAIIGLGLAAVALAGCDDPAWRNPAASKGTSALPPEVVRVIVEGGPRKASDHLLAQALPPPPAWAADLVGKGLQTVFPNLADCLGNTDGVKARYTLGAGGSRVAGWGWDAKAKAPIGRVVLIDRNALIRGAGEGGYRRKDVPKALPDVTSEATGWQADTALSSGPLDAYGVLADGKTICRLGHVDL